MYIYLYVYLYMFLIAVRLFISANREYTGWPKDRVLARNLSLVVTSVPSEGAGPDHLIKELIECKLTRPRPQDFSRYWFRERDRKKVT